MKVIAATGNQGKLREFRRILEPLGFSVTSMKEEGHRPGHCGGWRYLCRQCPHQGHGGACPHRSCGGGG